MGIAERKDREKQEMRTLIMEAATAMFIEEGYDKTSIRNIADKIEYSPATIYLYFKDKDELFFAIHEVGFEMMLKQMQKIAGVKNPLKRLREIGATYINFALKNPEYYDLMFIMRAPINSIKDKHSEEQCWKYGEATLKFVQDTVQECIDKKMIKTGNAHLGAMYTWSMVHGMVSLQIRDRFSVMEMNEAEIKKAIMASLDELIGMMAL